MCVCIINARTVVADDRHDRASFDGYTQHILLYYIYIYYGHWTYIIYICIGILYTRRCAQCAAAAAVRHSDDDDFFLRG